MRLKDCGVELTDQEPSYKGVQSSGYGWMMMGMPTGCWLGTHGTVGLKLLYHSRNTRVQKSLKGTRKCKIVKKCIFLFPYN